MNVKVLSSLHSYLDSLLQEQQQLQGTAPAKTSDGGSARFLGSSSFISVFHPLFLLNYFGVSSPMAPCAPLLSGHPQVVAGVIIIGCCRQPPEAGVLAWTKSAAPTAPDPENFITQMHEEDKWLGVGS